MPDFKTRAFSTDLVVRNTAIRAEDILRSLPLKGRLSQRLQDALKNGGAILRRADLPPSGKQPYVSLSPKQPFVENKGELRLFNASLVHPSWDVATFEVFDGSALIWFYGLKTGADYSAKVRVKAFPKDVVNGPTPNEQGSFYISASGNTFNVKPTYKEQVIPVSFLQVANSFACIYITGQDSLLTWDFFDVSIIETVL